MVSWLHMHGFALMFKIKNIMVFSYLFILQCIWIAISLSCFNCAGTDCTGETIIIFQCVPAIFEVLSNISSKIKAFSLQYLFLVVVNHPRLSHKFVSKYREHQPFDHLTICQWLGLYVLSTASDFTSIYF